MATAQRQQTNTADARQLVRADMARMEPEFANALPKTIPAERFMRIIQTALSTKPDIVKTAAATELGKQSLIAACMKAAQDGLVLDDREATIVLRSTKVKGDDGKDAWVQTVSYMPMVQGLLKKIRNSGEVSTIACHVVFAKDKFRYIMGDSETLEHEPNLDVDDRGAMRFVYMVARLKDGGIVREVLTRQQVEQRKAMSLAANGPWKTWEEEMWRKSALRAGSKYLPNSADKESGQNIMDIIARDDELTATDIDPTTGEVVAPTPGRRPRRSAARTLDADAGQQQGTTIDNDPPADTVSRGEEEDGDVV